MLRKLQGEQLAKTDILERIKASTKRNLGSVEKFLKRKSLIPPDNEPLRPFGGFCDIVQDFYGGTAEPRCYVLQKRIFYRRASIMIVFFDGHYNFLPKTVN